MQPAARRVRQKHLRRVEHAMARVDAAVGIEADGDVLALLDIGIAAGARRIAASRVPSWQIVNPALSPDGEWLAMPLTDRYTTNIWALSTKSGEWRWVELDLQPLTDAGGKVTGLMGMMLEI